MWVMAGSGMSHVVNYGEVLLVLCVEEEEGQEQENFDEMNGSKNGSEQREINK